MSLSDKAPLDAAADIAQGAAATWYIGRATSNDPRHVRHEPGRLPTVLVRNDAQYVAAAAGQIGIFHVLWAIFGMPYLVITLGLTVIVPGFILNNHHLAVLVIPLFFFWCWLFGWRLFLRVLLRHGPKIERPHDYQGILPKSRS